MSPPNPPEEQSMARQDVPGGVAYRLPLVAQGVEDPMTTEALEELEAHLARLKFQMYLRRVVALWPEAVEGVVGYLVKKSSYADVNDWYLKGWIAERAPPEGQRTTWALNLGLSPNARCPEAQENWPEFVAALSALPESNRMRDLLTVHFGPKNASVFVTRQLAESMIESMLPAALQARLAGEALGEALPHINPSHVRPRF